MKLAVRLLLLITTLYLFSCSSSDDDEVVRNLYSVDYTDFHHSFKSGGKLYTVDYDTVVVSDLNNLLLDSVKFFFATENQTTLADTNNISFSLLDDNKIKYIENSLQTIATKKISQDSIYILKNNNENTPVFVVRNKNDIQRDFFRTISAYHLKYDGEEKEEIVENELLTSESILKKLELNSLEVLKDDDYLVWVNVYYWYQ